MDDGAEAGAELVRGLQERAARAQPAAHTEIVDGWWLRHAPGCAWWVGTVLPHGDVPPGELVPRVAAAERFSVARGGAYAAVSRGDTVVAVGRAVADDGWAGVFGMVTRPGSRGQGAARAVLAALAGWAGSLGIDRMYLQVEAGNGPARRLYERAGFGEVCPYHYRTAW